MPDQTPLCPTHNAPMITYAGKNVCSVEHVLDHLSGKRIVDLLPSQNGRAPALIFADGHTLPLYCADCNRPLKPPISDDEMLDYVSSLSVVCACFAPLDDEPQSQNAFWIALGSDLDDEELFDMPLSLRSVTEMATPIREG
jgi:hypothetical protein